MLASTINNQTPRDVISEPLAILTTVTGSETVASVVEKLADQRGGSCQLLGAAFSGGIRFQ